MGREEEKIEFVKSMQVLELKENDILVFKTDERFSAEAHKHFKEAIEECLPDNIKGKVKMWILESGMDLGVIRKGEDTKIEVTFDGRVIADYIVEQYQNGHEGLRSMLDKPVAQYLMGKEFTT